MSSRGEQIGAQGAVSEVTVKVKVRTFLKGMGYGVELIEDALKLHGPDQDLCVQYCAARSPKQTPTVAQPSSLTPMVQQKRDDLWQHLSKKGFRVAHINFAIERCNIDAQSVSSAFTWCCDFIQRELEPPGKPTQPLSQAPLTTSWKAKVATPALAIREQLKSMGYTDQQVDAAVTAGCSDLNACVQYLLSAESSSKVSSHAPASAPSPGDGGGGASTSSKMVISSNERQLEYKGWLYRTANERRVDQTTHASDGMFLADVPSGWDLCFLDADVLDICRTFGWSSHALVLRDGRACYTAACTAGCTPGDIGGGKCLTLEYVKEGKRVSSSRTISDVLLRKPATAPVDATAPKQNPSNAPTSSLQGSQVSATAEEFVAQHLRDQGWTEAGIGLAIYTVRQRTGKVSLQDCMDYLNPYSLMYKRKDTAPRASQGPSPHLGSAHSRNAAPSTVVALPVHPSSAQYTVPPSGRVLSELMCSMEYPIAQVDDAIRNGCLDMGSCIDYIAKHYRDASPPKTSEGAVSAAFHAAAPARAPAAPAPAPAAAVAPELAHVSISADGKQLEYKGWLYRTAHERRVDQKKPLNDDGMLAIELLPGWELCPFGHDAQDVIKSNPWGSHALLFASGSGCLTFACNGGYAGDLAYANNGFVFDGARYCCKSPQDDILLRRRAQSSGSPHVSAAAPASPPKATASLELPQAIHTSPAPMSHQELAKRALLCEGTPVDPPRQSVFAQHLLTRQEFDMQIEVASGKSNPVEEVYTCHSRLGLQAALHLCHPTFAAEDDYMVAVARASIRANVLDPLAEAGWNLCPQFDALWKGDRGVGLVASEDQLMPYALAEHPCRKLSMLPLAFPAAYSESVAIYLASRDADAPNGSKLECTEVLGCIRQLYDTDATFKQMLLYADSPSSVGSDFYGRQVVKMLSEATYMKSLPAYRPELKHFAAAEGRRRHRGLCVCIAHLVIQSKILHLQGKINGESPNALQPDIDKLICVATAAHPKIGELVSLMFEKPPYTLPSVRSEAVEIQAFHQDLSSLIEDEKVYGTIASHFDVHFKWLLDAASGCIALSEDMLLDACSTDVFARALIKRAALLKFPILAASETTCLIEGNGEDQTEQEQIKGHLSGFAGLGTALDSFWSEHIEPTRVDLHPIRCNLALVKTSTRSARWMLAVERNMRDRIKLLLKIPYASKSGASAFLTQASIFLQTDLMSRVVKLLKFPSACDRDLVHLKIKDSENASAELCFFSDIIVPRLAQAGFSQIPAFLDAVQKQAMHDAYAASRPDFIDQFHIGPGELASMEWIEEFKQLWKRI